MKWHVGLLADDPHEHRSYQWMRRQGWTKPGFPEDVRDEIWTWLHMPGFGVNFQARSLGVTAPWLVQVIKKQLPPYEQYRDRVHENWASATREDCIRLSQRYRGERGRVPLMVQLAILDEVKRGGKQRDVCQLFNVDPMVIQRLQKNGPGSDWFDLPEEFRLLTVGRV